MLQNGPKSSTKRGGKKGDKNGKLDLGDLLGRSKDGFMRVRTEEGDDDDEAGLSTDDSEDELGQFAVPNLRA